MKDAQAAQSEVLNSGAETSKRVRDAVDAVTAAQERLVDTQQRVADAEAELRREASTGGPVADLKVFDDDGAGPRPPALYAVGKFTHAGGVSSPGIARWGVVICPADFNADGVTNSQDFFEFLSAFFAGAADFNHDGAVNSADFFDYLDTFFGAC